MRGLIPYLKVSGEHGGELAAALLEPEPGASVGQRAGGGRSPCMAAAETIRTAPGVRDAPTLSQERTHRSEDAFVQSVTGIKNARLLSPGSGS